MSQDKETEVRIYEDISCKKSGLILMFIARTQGGFNANMTQTSNLFSNHSFNFVRCGEQEQTDTDPEENFKTRCQQQQISCVSTSLIFITL